VTESIARREIEAETHALVLRAEAVTIETAADYAERGECRRALKDAHRRIDETFGRAVKAAHAAHVAAKDLEKQMRAPLVEADSIVEQKRVAYRRAQAEREAAERAKAEAEAAARVAAAQRDIETAAALGDADLAQDIADSAAAEAVAIVAAVPKLDTRGTALRHNWRFEVTDSAAVPREFCTPDERRIGEIVRRDKGATAIPGVRVWCEERESMRS
jgi:hypothetical protein